MDATASPTGSGPTSPQSLWRAAWVQAGVTALGAWALALFFSAPSLHEFESARLAFMRSGDFLKMCADPLTRDLKEPLLAYRVFPPFVGWLLGANRWVCIALPYLATIAMLGCVAHAVARRAGAVWGRWAALLVSGCYAVTWPNCLLGYADSFAHLAAAILLLTSHRVAVVGCVAAGILSDERFVFALPFVALWHGVDWVRRCRAGVGLGVALALLVRLSLKWGWIGPGIAEVRVYKAIGATIVSGQPWGMSWSVWLANVALSYRWAWVLLGFAIWARWAERHRGSAAAAALAVGVSVGATFIVFDVARSVAFTWVMLPLAVVWLAERREVFADRLIKVTALAVFLTPNIWLLPDFVWWWWPLPVRIHTYFTGA